MSHPDCKYFARPCKSCNALQTVQGTAAIWVRMPGCLSAQALRQAHISIWLLCLSGGEGGMVPAAYPCNLVIVELQGWAVEANFTPHKLRSYAALLVGWRRHHLSSPHTPATAQWLHSWRVCSGSCLKAPRSQAPPLVWESESILCFFHPPFNCAILAWKDWAGRLCLHTHPPTME